jgi:hypothetical protein
MRDAMGQSSLGYNDEEPDEQEDAYSPAQSMPEDASDRQSTSMESPNFELPKEDDTPTAEAAQIAPDDGAPGASTQAVPPVSQPGTTGIRAASNPEVRSAFSALDNLRPPPPALHQHGADDQTESMLQAQGRAQDAANERGYQQQKQGLYSYLHQSGVSISTGPDGQPRVDMDADGNPQWQSARSAPFQNDDGRWVTQERDTGGAIQERDLLDTGAYKVDRTTGDQYIGDGMGGRIVLGKDAPTVARLAISQQRSQLQIQNRADQIALAQIAQAASPLRAQVHALQGSAPIVGGLIVGSTVKQLEQRAQQGMPDGSPDKDAIDALSKWNAQNPQYATAQAALDAANQAIQVRKSAILQRRDAALTLGTSPNAPSVGALAAPTYADPATTNMPPGTTTPDHVAVLAAAEAAKSGTTSLKALDGLTQTLAKLGVQVPHPAPPSAPPAAASTGDPNDNGVSATTNFFGSVGLSANQTWTEIHEAMDRLYSPLYRVAGLSGTADELDANADEMKSQRAALRAIQTGQTKSEWINPAMKDSFTTGIARVVPDLAAIAAGAIDPAIPLLALTAKGAAEGGGAAEDAGNSFGAGALKGGAISAATLAAFAGTGKIAELALANRVASPVARFLAATATSGALNVAADATITKMQGGSAIPQTPAEWAQRGLFDLGFAALHGWSESKLPDRLSVALKQIGLLDAQQKDAGAPRTPEEIATAKATTTQRAQLQSFLDDHKGIIPPDLQAGATQTAQDPGRQYRDILKRQDDIAGKYETARDNNDVQASADFQDQRDQATSDLHALIQPRVDAIPEEQRASIARAIDPTTDIQSVEAQLRDSPNAAFAAQSIGSDPGVRQAYIEPTREHGMSILAEKTGDPAAASRLVDQHVGLAAARDLWGVVSDSKPIDQAKAAALADPNVGLLVQSTDATGRPVMKLTHDALPLLTDGQRVAVKATPGRFLIDDPAGTPLSVFHQHVESGMRSGLRMFDKPAPVVKPSQHNVTVLTRGPGETAPTAKTVPVKASSEVEAHAKAVARTQSLGHTVVDSAIDPAKQPNGGITDPERPNGPNPDWIRQNNKVLADVAERSGVADKIEQLHAERFTAKQIADKLGIDVNMVRAVRSTRGLPERTDAVTFAGAGGGSSAPENPEFTKWAAERASKQTPRSFTPAKPSDFTAEGKEALKTLMPAFNRNKRLFSALGIDAPKFVKLADRNMSGLATSDRHLLIDGDLLHGHFQNLEKAGVAPRDWATRALTEEIIHKAQRIGATNAGVDFDKFYSDLRNDPKLDPKLVANTREAYNGFDDLTPSAQGAEIVRMVIQGRWKGTITEQIYKAVQHVVDYLKGLDVKHSDLLDAAVKQTEEVLAKARDRARSEGLLAAAPSVGMKLRDVGKDFPKDDEMPNRLDVRKKDPETIAMDASKEFRKFPATVSAADGSTIRIWNPERDRISARVWHLIRDRDTNTVHISKAQSLPLLRGTLEHAAVRLIDPDTGYRVYLRQYGDGTKHGVIVKPDGEVESQKSFTGALTTQFPFTESNERGKGHWEIDWVRPREVSDGRSQQNPAPLPTDSTVAGPGQSEGIKQSTGKSKSQPPLAAAKFEPDNDQRSPWQKYSDNLHSGGWPDETKDALAKLPAAADEYFDPERKNPYASSRAQFADDAFSEFGSGQGKSGPDADLRKVQPDDVVTAGEVEPIWTAAMDGKADRFKELFEKEDERTPGEAAEMAQILRTAKANMLTGVMAGESMLEAEGHEHISEDGEPLDKDGYVLSDEHGNWKLSDADGNSDEEDEGQPLAAAPFKAVKDKLEEFGKAVKSLVAPPTVGDEAEHTALLTRENVAELAARREQMHAQLKEVKKSFDRMAVPDRLDFIHRMETGHKQATPELDGIAKHLRQAFDDRVQDVRALGTGKLQQAIVDYFPHIWKDPKAAADVYRQIFSKKPLEGSGNFLKKRSIPTIQDGMQWRVYDKDGVFQSTTPNEATAKAQAAAMGGHTGKPLEPVSTNPVDLAVLKAHEMDRYITAHRILGEMKSRGLARFVPATHKAPDGWKKIDDKIGTVMGQNVTQGLSAQTRANLGTAKSFVEAQTIRGHYYAPEDAARIINNYLSPGLAGNMLYDVVRAAGNHMNMVQLGLSAFHATGVTINSVVSRSALAVKQAFDGNIGQALGTAMRIPLAPYDALMTGSKVLREMIRPGSQGADIAKIAQSVIQAGGRGKMDAAYQAGAIKSFFDSWNTGSKAAALLKAPFAALEAMGHPLMAEFVPRIKLGVFADAARYELGRMAPGTDTMGQRKILAGVWDSIDNRFGQLAYDNLFWQKTLKDLAMISTRSVGWNLGTVRELGGGAVDALKAPLDIARGNGISHRLAYTVALPATVALMGAVYQYLHTGKGPDDLKDYFAPRTGRTGDDGTEERINLPTYMKDMRSYGTHPFQTIANKIHPLFAAIAQMIGNRDYYGTQIINPGDSIVQKSASELKFAASQFVPFSIAGGQQRQGQTLKAKAETFMGITPAPAETVRSKAMQILHDYHQMQAPNTRTSADVAKWQTKSKLMSALRPAPGKQPDVTPSDAVQRALKEGLTVQEAKAIIKESREPAKLLPFKGVPLDIAERAYESGTPEEKNIWGPALMQKRANAMKRSSVLAN